MRLDRLDLNQLIALEALLAERSVSRAAQRLFLSQSAMSWTLARLREHFGDPLLVRAGKSMILTPFAAALVAPLCDALLRVRSIVARRPDMPVAETERVLRIVASDYVAHTVLAQAMAVAAREAPRVSLQLHSLVDFQPGTFEEGRIDLLVSAHPLLDARHPSMPLLSDDYVAVVARENTAVSSSLTMDQYLAAGHVVVRWRGGRIVTMDEAAMRDMDLHRREEVVIPHFTLVPPFVLGTARIATVQRRLATILTDHQPLRIVELAFALPSIDIAMQWHRYCDDDPMIRWLRNLLVRVAL